MLATRNLLAQIKLPQSLLSSKNLVFLGLVLILTACRTQSHTLSTATSNHTTAQVQKDSIFVHDSVFVRIRADTVYLEKWHTRWRDREITKTDTIQVETTKTETIQVRYIPKFYKYCTALTALLLIAILAKFMLFLYKKFH